MKRNYVQLFNYCIARMTSNFLGRISLTLSLLQIFNFIRYAKCTTHDITVHYNFSKIIRNSQRDRYIPHKSAGTKRFIVVYTPCAIKSAISKILIMHSDVISCLICIYNKVEYLEKYSIREILPRKLHCHFMRSLQRNKK